VFYCVRCGLASDLPGIHYDEEGVCSQCRSYERIKERAQQYFKPMDELRTVLQEAKNCREGDYDCLALVSGGKDSTYMLGQLAGMGIKVLAFTLDNGYISMQAKENIQKVAAHLGVDHIFQTTPTMNAIFADSLRQYSNVCNGCFKTLYTLAVQIARQKGIPYIITGLSRGQFFETRLTEDVFREGALDNESIDRAILEARKIYHRSNDLISRSLDVDSFRDDSVFEDIQFIDFYRYCDVGLSELYAYLDEHLPWIRPDDTGRSTNCLINDVGIYMHKKQLGFHNYALPYSWDVRMGHKTRAAALEELNDEIDETRVKNILAEIGYREPEADETAGQQLIAYYVSPQPLPADELRSHMLKTLPDYMTPAFFVHLETIPLTPNGKVDRKSLPKPGNDRPLLAMEFIAPRTELEAQVAVVWCEILHLDRVGVNDDFFELGGRSLSALQVISRLVQNFQVKLPIPRFFENPTIANLSQVIEDLLIAEIEELSDSEAGQQLKMDCI
jgi:acyl carrier protein